MWVKVWEMVGNGGKSVEMRGKCVKLGELWVYLGKFGDKCPKSPSLARLERVGKCGNDGKWREWEGKWGNWVKCGKLFESFGSFFGRNVAEGALRTMEARDEVAGEVDELKARNAALAAEVEVLRARVRALEARNEAQVRRANDAWRQMRAILAYALRG